MQKVGSKSQKLDEISRFRLNSIHKNSCNSLMTYRVHHLDIVLLSCIQLISKGMIYDILISQVTLVESRTSTGIFRKEMRIEADPNDFRI